VITEEALEKTCRSRSGINLVVPTSIWMQAEDIDIAAQHKKQYTIYSWRRPFRAASDPNNH